MSYSFAPHHTGLVAHIGNLDGAGAFYVEARPCVGYVTTVNRYRGEEQAQTSLAVLDGEFEYVVRGLDDISAHEPAAVIVAVLPAGQQPAPEVVADRERLSRECWAMYTQNLALKGRQVHGRKAAA